MINDKLQEKTGQEVYSETGEFMEMRKFLSKLWLTKITTINEKHLLSTIFIGEELVSSPSNFETIKYTNTHFYFIIP